MSQASSNGVLSNVPALGQMGATRLLPAVALWAAASAIAMFFALLFRDSAVIHGKFIPLTNDSFYHARRILDALGSRGFYQYDERLNAPVGTWIPWPWAYDYLVAKATQVVLWLRPGADPMSVISHVPVAWVGVNAALFLAGLAALRLSFEMRLLGIMCFALSPLTQLLHALGMIDHHFIEHTFVLLCIWLGLKWFASPADRRWAAALGVALGIAPGFQAGLFVLQLAPLTCVFVLWLHRAAPPRPALIAFSLSLLVSIQAVLWPAATFRAGLFDFALLSLFHLYVAVGTALSVLFMSWRPFSRRCLIELMVIAATLASPIVAQALRGIAFVSGRFSFLSDIVEAQSVYRLMTVSFGPLETASYYSWLVLLAPALLLFHGYRLVKERSGDRLYFSIVAILGIAMLLTQFRFHYYGFFALIASIVMLVDEARRRFGWHRGGVFVATLLAVTLAYQPILRHRLFEVYMPSADPKYATGMPIYEELSRQCATDPGIVLASTDDGNPILFHSDCSVVANNFISTDADREVLARLRSLMTLPPDQIRSHEPGIKYLIVRSSDFGFSVNGQFGLAGDLPMVQQLFVAPKLPAGFTLLSKANKGANEVRLYKIASARGSVD